MFGGCVSYDLDGFGNIVAIINAEIDINAAAAQRGQVSDRVGTYITVRQNDLDIIDRAKRCNENIDVFNRCLLYTSPSPRD